MRIFGCAAYAHTRDGKLDPRSLKCVFLGYQEGTKGYRLWEKDAQGVKIIVSRDVIFNECIFPCKSISNSAGHSHENQGSSNQTEMFQFEVEPTTLTKQDIQPNETEITEAQTHTNQNQEDEEDLTENMEEGPNDEIAQYQLARDKVRREIRPPARFSYADLVYTALLADVEIQRTKPNTYAEAISSKDSKKWLTAMKEEMESLRHNKTWILVPKPKNQKLVECKWLYKLKDGINQNDPPRFKARLVAKGYTQRAGIDFTEIFSPVVKFKTIRLMLSIVAQYDLEIEQLDVKTAFLHGELDESIYMSQPLGFKDRNLPEHVCLLKKSLYGLKQSPRQWYKRFDTFILGIGFTRSMFDSCFYFACINDMPIYLLLYVDDMLLISKSIAQINELKVRLSAEFDMKDLGRAKKILGMLIDRNRSYNSLKLHQLPYLQKLTTKYGMADSKGVSMPLANHFILSKAQCPKTESDLLKMENVPYSNVIGSIMYVMISTRPDLSYSISLLSKFMSNPGYEHWNALKWLLRYINSTVHFGLNFCKRNASLDLVGYVDSDFAGDRDSRKSTTAYYFTLGGNCISWKSQLQPLVALSTTEAEYVAVTDAFKEATWLQGILREANLLEGIATVYSDSQSAIHLSKNPVYHERTKHVDVRYHYVRDLISKGKLSLMKIHTDENPADMGTKVVTVGKFKHCLDLLHIK